MHLQEAVKEEGQVRGEAVLVREPAPEQGGFAGMHIVGIVEVEQAAAVEYQGRVGERHLDTALWVH